MGTAMAKNLHKAGLLSAVWNRTTSKAHAFGEAVHCHVSHSISDLVDHCEALVICVAADEDLQQIITTLQPTLRPGMLVIDCSTVSANTARTCAALIEAVHCHFLDAPVSGGVEGAQLGTLAIMVGGPTEAFSQALPIFNAMGKTVTHFGGNGCGQAAKAANQILCAGAIQAAAEAMAFAKAEGLPLDKLIDTLSKGAGSSWYFTHRAPNMISECFAPGFRVKLHDKDLKICRDMAKQHGAQLPLVEMTLLQYRRLIEQGHGDEDISTLFRFKTALFKKS